MHAKLLLALAATAVLVGATPTAASTDVDSADHLVRASVGLLSEPAVTYQQTGLDVCFTENNAERRVLQVNPDALTATLYAPNGQSLAMALKAQTGRAGCVTFEEAIVPTEPGQYLVSLNGLVNGSTIAVTKVPGGTVGAERDLTFPATDVPTKTELASQLALLQAQVDALQAQVEDLEMAQDDGRFAPGAPAAFVGFGLLALVAVRRRA